MRSCTFKGSIEVEKVDKNTYDSYSINWGNGDQAIENAEVGEKARKVMVDGELRIIRGEKVYDATGRQL
jgi:hypothetical protein